MSLCVYLRIRGSVVRYGTGVFVRENGTVVELSQDEVLSRFGKFSLNKKEITDIVYSACITHNLTSMANEAGLYKCIWYANENGIYLAFQMIDLLKKGLDTLKRNPKHFRKFNPKNGWGNYESFVQFIEGYLEACINAPDAVVLVHR